MYTFFNKFGFLNWQLPGILLLSIAFWLNGIRIVGIMNYYSYWGGIGSIIIFIVSFPVAYLAIKAVSKILKLTEKQVYPAIILIVAIVGLLHGIALTYKPEMYKATGDSLLFATAWIIWFCGATILSLFFIQQKDS
jgi:divalent metal cation (Fe/Co/Zn/Cd) transporter